MNNLTPKILIVDDDEDSRLMLSFLLETWSYQVIGFIQSLKLLLARRLRS